MLQTAPRKRLLNLIEKCLSTSPATVLLGARQVGKTTLARMVAANRKNHHFFDLERAAGREALGKTPELTLADCSGLVVISLR
jgi:predicted AAA+ superfamily ATPase